MLHFLLSSGGGWLEVRGHGHRQDLPVGLCDRVCAGNTGTLPPACHQLLPMRLPSLSVISFLSHFVPLELLWELSLLQLFPHQTPGCLLSPFFWLSVSSLCFMLFSGTPSLPALCCLFYSHDLPRFPPFLIHLALSICTRSSLLLPVNVFSDMIITSAFHPSVSLLSCAMCWPAAASCTAYLFTVVPVCFDWKCPLSHSYCMVLYNV